LYSKHTGLHFFFSNKFHHGHKNYKNFKWETEGEHKGEIVEFIHTGSTDEEYLPINLSITKNVLTILIISFLMCWIFISIARRYQKYPDKAPKGSQNLFEPIILFIKNEIAIPSIGEKHHMRFMPFLLTAFFFIWFSNMLGLIPVFPGGANVTGNIAVTMVLALFTFTLTTITANKH
jgi:F-type H+-transporting ATPase subunit a